jgi:hypothetical protein
MTTRPADELDRLMDRLFSGRDTVADGSGEAQEDQELMLGLIGADARIGAPDPTFVASLRADLLDRHDGLRPPIDDRSTGIVAPPFLPLPLSAHPDRRLLAFAIAAAILIAVVGSGLRWNRDGHPSVNVATAQASTSPTFAPTMIATLTVEVEST